MEGTQSGATVCSGSCVGVRVFMRLHASQAHLHILELGTPARNSLTKAPLAGEKKRLLLQQKQAAG